MGLEVALALLSLYSLPHSVSVSRTGNGDWALETRFIRETTQRPSLGQSVTGSPGVNKFATALGTVLLFISSMYILI